MFGIPRAFAVPAISRNRHNNQAMNPNLLHGIVRVHFCGTDAKRAGLINKMVRLQARCMELVARLGSAQDGRWSRITAVVSAAALGEIEVRRSENAVKFCFPRVRK